MVAGKNVVCSRIQSQKESFQPYEHKLRSCDCVNKPVSYRPKKYKPRTAQAHKKNPVKLLSPQGSCWNNHGSMCFWWSKYKMEGDCDPYKWDLEWEVHTYCVKPLRFKNYN